VWIVGAIDIVTAVLLSLNSIQRIEASTADDGSGISNALWIAHTM
jgi:hypothetical protein